MSIGAMNNSPNAPQLGAPHSVIEVHGYGGARFYVRIHGRVGGPRLLLSHGNGMAINGYWTFWRQLCEQFEVIVFDFRNHGENPNSNPQDHAWPVFVDDLQRVLTDLDAALDKRPTVGIFHSMSSVTAILHWIAWHHSWAGLILFEPPLLPPEGHSLREQTLTGEAAVRDWALRREREFDRPDVLADAWSRKRAFGTWEAGTHLAMACSILRHDPAAGTWRLRCPPELEAKVYDENRHADAWHAIGAMPFPVLVYSGDSARESGPITARVSIAVANENGRDLFVQRNASHLPMLDDSALAAQVVVEYLRDACFRDPSARSTRKG